MSLAPKYATGRIYHTYVYRKYEYLNAGRIYHYETRNLRKRDTYQSNPDPVMYLVRNNIIAARNDDYNGLASAIIFRPTVSGNYLLLIRAYRTGTPGKCDLYRGIDGASPSRIATDILFGGCKVMTRWRSGETFETRLDVSSGGGDTYLYLIRGDYAGGWLYRNDDSGIGLCSRIPQSQSGSGSAIVGSYSRYSQGYCRLYLFYKSYVIPS